MNSQPPHTICLIQITRMGDLLQTILAARALRAERNDVRLILVARKQFAAPLAFLFQDLFDKYFFIDAHDITKTSDLSDAQNNLKQIVSEINRENISVCINLSFSKSSTYLASLIKATHQLGPHYDSNAKLIIEDRWSQFIYSVVMTGPLNPFNLVDVYKKILGVSTATKPAPKSWGKINTIIAHPFASTKKKTWKLPKWNELIFKVLKENPQVQIHIVGASSEQSDAEQIFNAPILKHFTSRLHNHVGKTSVMQLYELLQHSDLFIGHDSMVGHLAALAQVPTLTISLGCVRPIETMPYGENNYVISPLTKCFPCFPQTACHSFQCHADIPYQVSYYAIQQLISEGQLGHKYMEQHNSCFHLDSVCIQRSFFSEQGIMTTKNVLNESISLKETFRLFYRIGWLYLFDCAEEKNSFPVISNSVHKDLLHYMHGLQRLFELTEFGKRYSKFIIDELAKDAPDPATLREYSAKIDEIDQLHVLLQKSYPGLAPISNFLAIHKGNLHGTNIVQIAQSSYFAYDEASLMSSVLYELSEKTIAEHKLKPCNTTIGL